MSFRIIGVPMLICCKAAAFSLAPPASIAKFASILKKFACAEASLLDVGTAPFGSGFGGGWYQSFSSFLAGVGGVGLISMALVLLLVLFFSLATCSGIGSPRARLSREGFSAFAAARLPLPHVPLPCRCAFFDSGTLLPPAVSASTAATFGL